MVKVQVPPGVVEPFLARTELFKAASRQIVAQVAAQFHGYEAPPGTTLLEAGVVGDGLGILFDGSARLMLPGSQGAVLSPGTHFGEVSILLGTANPYAVVSDDTCRVLWLPAAYARNLFGAIPALSSAIGRGLAERLAQVCALERTVAELVETPAESEEEAPLQPTSRPAHAEDEPAPGTIPFVEVGDYDPSAAVLAMVPSKLVRQHRVIPLKIDGRKLTLGMVQPRNPSALSDLRGTLSTVELDVVAIAMEDFVQSSLRFKLEGTPRVVAKGAGTDPNSIQFETVQAESDREREAGLNRVGDEVIRYTNKMIAVGLDMGASDIHIECSTGVPRIRFRVSGVLQDWTEPTPGAVTPRTLAARVKVLAGMDITEKRLPQDGRIGFSVGKTRDVDLRVSTLPASRGEKIVLRVLEASGSTRPLEAIFLENNTLQNVRRALNRPYGGIIVGGPTGSGKTSTLYSILNERKTRRPDTNIIMVEDPIEYRLPGVTQVQVNPAAGLGFSQVLRSMLRQDPDVIVVGETRDHDTAVIALEAAMTGHLLLTSLHANNAMAAVQRLENLGCGRDLISQSLSLVMVQRLARKLCPNCRRLQKPTRAMIELLQERKVLDQVHPAGLPHPVGCEQCNHSGYIGRVVICEALQVTDEIRHALADKKPLSEIEKLASELKALVTFPMYSAALMMKQAISPNEVLLSVAD